MYEFAFNKLVKNLTNAIFDYMENTITIDDLISACLAFVCFLKFDDVYIDL